MAKKKNYDGLGAIEIIKAKSGIFFQDDHGQLHGYLELSKLQDEDGRPIVEVDGDTAYQRSLRHNQVSGMAANWVPEAQKAIMVGLRHDGSLRIIDGQQEVGAMIQLKHKHVWCRIIPDCTPKKEASLFFTASTSASLSSGTRFRAALRAGIPKYVSINGSVERYGFKINLTKGRLPIGVQVISSVATLETLHAEDVLDDMFEVITRSFKIGNNGGVDAKALDGQFMLAIGDMLLGGAKPAELIRGLSKRNATEMYRAAYNRSEGARRGNNSLRSCLVNIFTRLCC